MKKDTPLNWTFTGNDGTFTLSNPHHTSYLYFPLVNEAEMMSVVTPTLHGDIKTGQNTFLNIPVSVEDLHLSRAARNIWITVEGAEPWSATGNSAPQIANRFAADSEETPVTLKAGFLWHRITRRNAGLGLQAEITSFVPPGDNQVELMKVTLTNLKEQPITFQATAAIPMYGRSADNLRDHRHVTALLNQLSLHSHGVLLKPTLSFDEKGHRPNTVTYSVLGFDDEGAPPVGFYPVLGEFIGEGGSLDWPAAVINSRQPDYQAGQSIAGFEAIGGLRFAEYSLPPAESRSYVLVMAVTDKTVDLPTLKTVYGSADRFDHWFEQNQAHWEQKLNTLIFHTGNARFNNWLKWVEIQPILRRLFGNSFLPYHDYGRGGRGWRDLWQDTLVLLMMEPDNVGELLLSFYAGVRIDGSNATIIGNGPGEFKADRNNIPRIWMDHGAWPFLTTKLYIDQSGKVDFLLAEQNYFKDQFTERAGKIDPGWNPEQGTRLRTAGGELYRGSILEHLLVQHLTPFFNVGVHNNIRLEGADWNDGLDMAPDKGESVAFTALYAANLRQLADLVTALKSTGVTKTDLVAELTLLLDTLTTPVDYTDVYAKQRRLADYFSACTHQFSGEKISVPLDDLVDDLKAKADWLYTHLRSNEWITDSAGYGWFNSYYDNDGQQVEGEHPAGIRMILTGQVFALMGGIATPEQAEKIVRAVDHYLFDETVGGCRLNTDFGEVLLNLGRCFGFAFGHKENGAMFSHMAVMYAFALYQRGFVAEGHRILDTIFRHTSNFAVSRMYPGLPEYIDSKGRGVYPYLTGSASWYLLVLLTEVFGVKGVLGDLVLEPKLTRSQFDESGFAGVETLFAEKRLVITYHNPARLNFDQYTVRQVSLNGKPISFEPYAGGAIIPRTVITALPTDQVHRIEVTIG